VDLKGARADELRLHSVTEKEGHHAGVDLILQHPGCPGGRLLPDCLEGVEGGEYHEDDGKLDYTKELCGLEPEATRRVVVPTDEHVWVFLLQYSGILLKHPLVASGVAVEELDGGAHQLGELGLGDVLLGLCFYVTNNKE